MIVLSESSPQLERSAAARELKISTDAALLMGHRVHYIASDFERCGTASNALAHVAAEPKITPGAWIGYIPTPRRYREIYEAALEKNIKLVNSPEQHITVQEFDRAYPLISSLTPRTMTVTTIDDCQRAASEIGFPAFVKGAVQSLKHEGTEACVALNGQELRSLAARLLRLQDRSRGRVIVRRFVRLRYRLKSGLDFPIGREYRAVLYEHRLMGLGYYWQGEDQLGCLTLAERDAIVSIAVEGSRRIGTPYIAIDVGQLESGEWTIIETGDPQFAGLCQIQPFELWSSLRAVE